MAVTELHRRLEHLVTYSSQLIFISGDSMGAQQRSLQAFLGQQSENAEIAYLNAEPDGSKESYRQQIHRQLLGHEQGFIKRPLNELLAPLNHHEGPVLICICQAENLSKAFLQELWELVLQSRFASNRQHLNVLLFGHSQWATQAKTWLPANNREKPVLLSTESIVSQHTTTSELDQLIASKRQQFAQRLALRANPEPPAKSQTKLQTWWFRAVVSLMFIAIFAGNLLWQYADEVPKVWHQLQAEGSQAPTPIVEVTEPTASESPSAPQESPFEIVQSPVDTALIEQTESTAPTAEQPVTDWQSQVQLMRDRAKTFQTQTSDNTPAESTPQTLNTPDADTTSEPAIFPAQGEVNDYPVEDIVSVEQLTAQAPVTVTSEAPAADESLPSPRVQQNTNATREPAPGISEIPNEEVTAAATSATTVVQNIPLAHQQLASLASSDVLIQVAGLSDPGVLQDFITDNQLADEVWIYRTQKFGGDWYVLVVNQVFTDVASAQSALSQLPATLQKGNPFIKTATAVQRELALQP